MKDKQDKSTIDIFGGDYTLAQVKKQTMEKAQDKGCECPVCGQFVKVYARTITSTMARQLIYAWHMYGDGQLFHVKHLVMGMSGVGDFPKLEHWGMISQQWHQVGDEGKRTSGLWRITDRGAEFLKGELAVPKYVFLYNAIKRGESVDETITIRDAPGKKFNYVELMAPARAHGSHAALAGV